MKNNIFKIFINLNCVFFLFGCHNIKVSGKWKNVNSNLVVELDEAEKTIRLIDEERGLDREINYKRKENQLIYLANKLVGVKDTIFLISCSNDTLVIKLKEKGTMKEKTLIRQIPKENQINSFDTTKH